MNYVVQISDILKISDILPEAIPINQRLSVCLMLHAFEIKFYLVFICEFVKVIDNGLQ